MKRVFSGLVLFIGLVYGAAAAVPPDQLVRQTTDKVLSELTQNREALEQDKERLYALVDEIVLPHFDFERMSRFVLGKHWKSASPEQQEKFVAEFRTLLVRTYATALFEYTGQEVIFKPFRHEEGDRRAVVKTEVQQEDGPPIPMDYALIQNSDEWKVYDVKIENLSLVANYRAQYGRMVENQGLDALIASLSEKNKKLMSGQ